MSNKEIMEKGLNVRYKKVFGKIAAQWRKENPTLKGNIRDYATVEQLLVMVDMENYHAILIE